MTELMKRYEAETGCASVAIWRGEFTVSDEYVAWLECRLLKLERSIRGVIDLLNITDVPIPPALEGEVK